MTAIRRTSVRLASLAAFAASLALVLGGALGAFPSARAGDPPPAPGPVDSRPGEAPPAAAGAEAELMLADEIQVSDILKLLAKLTRSSITWSDMDKSISVRKIRSDGSVFRVDRSRLFDTVRALLANEEILLVPYGPDPGRMYRATDARNMASQFILKIQPDVVDVTEAMLPELLGQGGRFVTTTIRVKNLADLREARTALQRLITQNNVGTVTEVPAARAFVVTDFAPNVAVIYRTIQAMDVPPAPLPTAEAAKVSPAYFVLKHAPAHAVAGMLNDLFREKSAPPPAPAPAPGVAAAPAAPQAPSPRITFDDETHQVIVIASAADVATMKEIVLHLDVEPSK